MDKGRHLKAIAGNYLSMVSVALLGGVLTLAGYKLFVEESPAPSPSAVRPTIGFVENTTPVTLTSDLPMSAGLPDLTEAAEISTPGVVHVKSNFTMQGRRNAFMDPMGFDDFFMDPFSRRQPRQVQSSGSGVITSPDGYIVTNNHVIKDAESIEVVLYDGRSYEAQLVGTDPSTDIALLKIEEGGLDFISFGNSDELRIGEWVLAVGNPFNLTSTVTAGIVSAKARNINILKDRMAVESFIQTDAAVNPGNSGGALVNSRGELVGINTAIASNTGSYAGYSFAVPAEIVKKVIKDLMTHGVVQRAFLGADMVELNGEVARELQVDATQGVYLRQVYEGGSVEGAGLQSGDIITEVEDKDLRNAAELTEYVGRRRPGDKIRVTVLRDGRSRKYDILLKNQLGTTDVVRKPESQSLEQLGVELEDINPQELTRLNLKGGVRVSAVGNGKIRQFTDIRPGFIIVSLDNQMVSSVEDIKRILADKQGGVMLEGIYPDRPGLYYYAFGM